MNPVGNGTEFEQMSSSVKPSSYRAIQLFQNSSTKPTDVYNPGVPADWFVADGISSTMLVPFGAKAINTNALSYYVRNQAVETLGAPHAPSSNYGTAVGLFGVITCEVDGCASWAMNPTVTDVITGGTKIKTNNRKLIVMEGDINVGGSGTQVNAVNLQVLSSSSLPISADGYTASAASTRLPDGSSGDGFWSHAFVSADGAAVEALHVGLRSRVVAVNQPSQTIVLTYRDASATERGMELVSINDGINVTSTAQPDGLYFQAGDTHATLGVAGTSANSSLQLNAVGTGHIVALKSLVAQVGLFIPGSGGAPVPVTFGVADSGGKGYRVIRIPN
ncbi:hypothetical protein [Lichenihabitans psoromatis]|uniref:hypothetical protein n=1 Tax=Lichenihabitans psoromatis TaxID=2528642 RepID=UPI0010385DCC|nr:hypothetical protein [Lichenihabitans psoromatis]